MQTPTHILAGVVIQRVVAGGRRRALAFGLTAILAFLSHGVLDKLARITYHPPAADFRSPFWVGYHLVVLLATIAFLYGWWREFRWGIAFAILPDLDWVFIHGQEIFHIQIPRYQQPHLHHLLQRILEWTPFTVLDRLPNNRHHPWGCLWEVLLVAMLLVASRFLTRGPRPKSVQTSVVYQNPADTRRP
jgi:hypothetical protein